MIQKHKAAAIELVKSLGWEYSGFPYQENLDFGRMRYRKPGTNRYVTVGERTTCFFEKDDLDQSEAMRNIPTKNLDAIREECLNDQTEARLQKEAEENRLAEIYLRMHIASGNILEAIFRFACACDAEERGVFFQATLDHISKMQMVDYPEPVKAMGPWETAGCG